MSLNKKMLAFVTLLVLSLIAGAVGAQGPGVSEPGTLPIVDEPVTIEVMVRQRPGVEDYETNAYTLWFEEQTGVDLVFDVAPQNEDEALIALNVVLASGDLPDLFLGMPFSNATLAQLGADGLLLPLNDLIETEGTESYRIFHEDRPHLLPLITSPDGNIYTLPHINECFHCFNAQKMWIYQPWLDALGLEMPQTTAELEQVLIAFRDNDPNGNGVADEIPFSSSQGGWHNSPDRFLMNGFVYYDFLNGDMPRMINQDGSIVAAYTQDGYKEGLHYIASLVDQGLLDANAFIQDNDALRQLVNNPDTNIVGAFTSGAAGVVVEAVVEADGGRLDHWVTVPALEGSSGVRTMAYRPWGIVNGEFVVSADTEYPEIAARLGDFLYTFDATIRNDHGMEGTGWRFSDPGTPAIGGGDALYERTGVRSEGIQNESWNQTGITYRPSEFRVAESAIGNYTEVSLYEGTASGYAPYSPDLADLIPPVTFSADQAQEIADLRLGIDAYVDEMLVLFVTGGADIDAEWDNYLATLEGMGLPRLLEVYQGVFDGSAN